MLQLIFGPMFSGKSTELLRRIRRYEVAGRECVLINHASDTRYSAAAALATHDGARRACVSVTRLDEYALPLSVRVVGVDEAQFFDDIVEWCARVLRERGADIVLVVAALDGTFERRAFGRTLELVPLADDVVKLRAVCADCGADAPFTARTTRERAVHVVGGHDKYVAVCRACHVARSAARNV